MSPTPGAVVDAGTLNMLNDSYRHLIKAGEDSVIAAYMFGQCVDSFRFIYTRAQLADAMELSAGTLYRYTRLFKAYRTPELAIQAARELETYDISLLWQLQHHAGPVKHGRPLAGRHWRSTCRNCGGHEIHREEVDKDGNPIVTDEELAAIVHGPQEANPVPEVQFSEQDA